MLRGATILHIEDELEVRNLVRKILSAQGCRVMDASSGLAGAEIALREHPDLILLDVNLPDLDGYDVATKVRSHPELRRVPIVALTGSGDRELALALGCEGFIEKPFSADDLVAKLDRYLEGARDRRTGQHAALRRWGVRSVEKLEQKIAELEEAGRQLRRLERLRSEYLQNVTHELLTPLTPLLGYLGLLRNESLGPLSDKQRRCLETMRRSLARLHRQIENLTDLAHLEGGETTAMRSAVDPASVVERAVQACAEVIAERHIDLRRLVACEPRPAMLDERMVTRALAHLLDNAVKFSSVGGIVAIECARDGDGDLRLAVFDSGVGIPPGFVRSVFEPFQQVDGSPTRRYGGAGLGLAIARHVASAHGGSVWIESPPQRQLEGGPAFRGTCVTLKLPDPPS
jgi:signal transduction histidine kinase